MPPKKYSYLVTISTGDRATSDLLTRLKQNKRLGMFVSAAMESFLATEHGKNMADVFNPPKAQEEEPSRQETAVPPARQTRKEVQVSAPVTVQQQTDLQQGQVGVNIDFDTVFGASA